MTFFRVLVLHVLKGAGCRINRAQYNFSVYFSTKKKECSTVGLQDIKYIEPEVSKINFSH